MAIDSIQKTPPTDWRTQSTRNKQGSGEHLPVATGSDLSKQESILHENVRRIYDERLEKGVAREQARKDLPLSTYTEAYWKIDLHNLFHFLQLRMDGHAQFEIRRYAQVIGTEIVRRWCPVAWEAFCDYRLDAIHLSRTETKIIRIALTGDKEQLHAYLKDNRMLIFKNEQMIAARELVEIEDKLRALGINLEI